MAEQRLDYPKQVENTPKIKVCSFDDMDLEGNVELHILKPNRFNHPRLSFRSYQDSEQVYWGIVSKVDEKGNVDFEQIVLDGDVMRFNLFNLRDAKRWHIIRNSPFVKGSKRAFETGEMDCAYKIFDINKEAEIKIKKAYQAQDAVEWIKNLSEEFLLGLGRVYGLAPEANSLAVIKSALIEKAQKNPDSILAKKDKMSETNLLIVLRRAVAMQIVSEVPGIGFKYENQTLGVNDNTAVEYLRKNPDIAVAIDQFSKEKEKSGKIAKNISGGSQPPKDNKTWIAPKAKQEDELQV